MTDVVSIWLIFSQNDIKMFALLSPPAKASSASSVRFLRIFMTSSVVAALLEELTGSLLLLRKLWTVYGIL